MILPGLLVLVVLVTTPGRAAGQTSEADYHFDRARELYAEGRHAEALEHLLASHRLAPTADLTLTIARTYGYLERPVAAYNWYETYLTTFDLDETARATALSERDPLLARVAVVEVRTTPADAELFVDRTDLGSVGRAPRRVALTPGLRRVFARLAGHREASAEVGAVQGRIVVVALELTAMLGRLSVATTPPGASVRLAGHAEPLGTTPLEVEVPVGEVRLEITLDGYLVQTREVTIAEGETSALTLELPRGADTFAVLSVVAEPEGAAVLLDGEEVGRAPLTLSDLEPGRRNLEVRAAGRTPYATEILLEAGAATRVEATLADPDDRMWSGWRWIGYGGGGALLLAGGVVGVMALVHHDQFYESDNPTRAQLDLVESEGLATDILLGVGLVAVAVTLIVDLVRGRAPRSTGTVSLDR